MGAAVRKEKDADSLLRHGMEPIILIFLKKDSAVNRTLWGLSTLAKEFTAATRIVLSSSNELSTLVSGKV